MESNKEEAGRGFKLIEINRINKWGVVNLLIEEWTYSTFYINCGWIPLSLRKAHPDVSDFALKHIFHIYFLARIYSRFYQFLYCKKLSFFVLFLTRSQNIYLPQLIFDLVTLQMSRPARLSQRWWLADSILQHLGASLAHIIALLQSTINIIRKRGKGQ